MPSAKAHRTVVVCMINGLAASLLLACDMHVGRSPDGRTPGSATIDTINGVVHIANHGMGEWTARTAWRAHEIFRLGGERRPVDQLFTNQLLGTQIGPEGNVYILDHYAGMISVFSKEGELVRMIGRRGRGPSDLAAPTAFTWGEDGLIWVADPGNLKYVVFDTTGAFVRTHPRSTHVFPRRQYPLSYVDGLGIIDEATSDGDLILLRTTLSGDIHDTLLVIEREGGASQAMRDAAIRRPGPEFLEVGRHHVSRTKWALDESSGAVWTASTDRLRFVKLGLTGDTLLVVTADHRTSEHSAADERLISAAIQQSGLTRSEINPIRPIFQEMYVIDGGYLLVQLVDTPGVATSRFDVYDPTGRFLGELDVGFAPEPLGSMGSQGDLLVAPTLGDLDVPYVVGVELDRRDSGPGEPR